MEKSSYRLLGGNAEFSVSVMVLISFMDGVVASALGVGGGFMLVPILITFFGLPMYLLIAATIPFVIVLSLTGLYSCGQ